MTKVTTTDRPAPAPAGPAAESPSTRLRAAMGLLLPALSGAGTRLWYRQNLAEVYPRYLVAMHQVIRASVPLMEDAVRALRAVGDRGAASDRGAAGRGAGDRLIVDYLERHIPEERDHDDWVLEDLERLGHTVDGVLRVHPYPAVATLAGAQYYYIRHHDPAAIIGYIAQLEGYPPDEALLAAAAERTGLPFAAFRTMRKHAHLDPFHRRDLDLLVDALPPDPHRSALITGSALEAGAALVTLIEQVCARPPIGMPAPGPAPAPADARADADARG